jgi:hypothetical protein
MEDDNKYDECTCSHMGEYAPCSHCLETDASSLSKSEMIWIASKAFEKNISYEDLYCSDDMYGNENQIDEVYEYIIEAKDIGRVAWREKYSEYKLY